VSPFLLVVDDEPDEDLFRQQFSGRFTMDFAQSGASALQKISDAHAVPLILILSNINMPGMSGLELLPKAKASPPGVPIIMITAYGNGDTRRTSESIQSKETPMPISSYDPKQTSLGP
jgi:CheY-like chemotaxis protein